MRTPRELKGLYDQGKNISALLREDRGVERNTQEIIEIAYDLQTGSYIAGMENPAMAAYKRDYTAEIARTILSLCEPTSLLEPGVGEATTLSGVLQRLDPALRSHAFDLSWSRVAHARQWLNQQGIKGTTLCTGSLEQIPFADSSVDVVYTSHALEPNGGREEPILRELFRVTRKLLILLEPGYELASAEAKQRMDSHGYCKNVKGIAQSLGYKVLKHELFAVNGNPLNPTALTIIEKAAQTPPPAHTLACPRYKTPLVEIANALFSPEALVAYPVLGGIPCLRLENGVFASKYEDVMTAR